MNDMKLGHSANPDWQQAAADCLQQIGSTTNFNLAFIYVADGFSAELGKILSYLKKQSGIAHWSGSIGNGICCTNTEYYDQPAMVILTGEFAEGSFTLFDKTEHAHAPQATDDPYGMRLHFAVVHGDPRNGELPELIERLPEQLGNGYLVGGLTSSESQYFQIADNVVEGQLSGVVFDDQVEVVTGLSQGCSPIGETHVLTECDNHMAISIDGRPALDVFKEDIGEVLARDIDRAAGYIFAGFPVQGSDTGDYLVRNVIGIDPENDMLAIGDMMQPDRPIMFCRRDGRSAMQDMNRMLSDVKSRLNGRQPRGGLYFSCMGRGRHLFGDNSREMHLISDMFGDIPIAGFYANGEIAGQRLYGYTGVLTLFV